MGARLASSGEGKRGGGERRVEEVEREGETIAEEVGEGRRQKERRGESFQNHELMTVHLLLETHQCNHYKYSNLWQMYCLAFCML